MSQCLIDLPLTTELCIYPNRCKNRKYPAIIIIPSAKVFSPKGRESAAAAVDCPDPEPDPDDDDEGFVSIGPVKVKVPPPPPEQTSPSSQQPPVTQYSPDRQKVEEPSLQQLAFVGMQLSPQIDPSDSQLVD
jgi:hypothetical protein